MNSGQYTIHLNPIYPTRNYSPESFNPILTGGGGQFDPPPPVRNL